MLIKRPTGIRSSEITDKRVYVNRRAFLRAATASLGVVVAQCGGGSPPQAPPAAATPPGAPPPLLQPEAGAAPAASPVPPPVQPQPSAISGRKLLNVKTGSSFSTAEKVNTWQQITSYNNFYEFGIDKESPSRYAHSLRTSPWSIAVEGECARPAVWHLEDVLEGETFEERIYRLRCVEGWSMVVPWVGFPLSDFIRKVQPTGKAKFVEFTTLGDPEQMPGLRAPYLRWPYVEGLRMDEAMHPLAILAIGLYDEVLPNQNGAPIRLVVPWKYGFKSVKSIVRIRFVEEQPINSWQLAAPREYGFYANVNPTVDHPRWSQSHEVRLPGLFKSRPTEMFNGYGDEVAGLYGGMDLRVNF